jgi:hypothetical protein
MSGRRGAAEQVPAQCPPDRLVGRQKGVVNAVATRFGLASCEELLDRLAVPRRDSGGVHDASLPGLQILELEVAA